MPFDASVGGFLFYFFLSFFLPTIPPPLFLVSIPDKQSLLPCTKSPLLLHGYYHQIHIVIRFSFIITNTWLRPPATQSVLSDNNNKNADHDADNNDDDDDDKIITLL